MSHAYRSTETTRIYAPPKLCGKYPTSSSTPRRAQQQSVVGKRKRVESEILCSIEFAVSGSGVDYVICSDVDSDVELEITLNLELDNPLRSNSPVPGSLSKRRRVSTVDTQASSRRLPPLRDSLATAREEVLHRAFPPDRSPSPPSRRTDDSSSPVPSQTLGAAAEIPTPLRLPPTPIVECGEARDLRDLEDKHCVTELTSLSMSMAVSADDLRVVVTARASPRLRPLASTPVVSPLELPPSASACQPSCEGKGNHLDAVIDGSPAAIAAQGDAGSPALSEDKDRRIASLGAKADAKPRSRSASGIVGSASAGQSTVTVDSLGYYDSTSSRVLARSLLAVSECLSTSSSSAFVTPTAAQPPSEIPSPTAALSPSSVISFPATEPCSPSGEEFLTSVAQLRQRMSRSVAHPEMHATSKQAQASIIPEGSVPYHLWEQMRRNADGMVSSISRRILEGPTRVVLPHPTCKIDVGVQGWSALCPGLLDVMRSRRAAANAARKEAMATRPGMINPHGASPPTMAPRSLAAQQQQQQQHAMLARHPAQSRVRFPPPYTQEAASRPFAPYPARPDLQPVVPSVAAPTVHDPAPLIAPVPCMSGYDSPSLDSDKEL